MVLCRYGKLPAHGLGEYLDLVDVIFDHRPDQVSHGHFTSGVDTLEQWAARWIYRLEAFAEGCFVGDLHWTYVQYRLQGFSQFDSWEKATK